MQSNSVVNNCTYLTLLTTLIFTQSLVYEAKFETRNLFFNRQKIWNSEFWSGTVFFKKALFRGTVFFPQAYSINVLFSAQKPQQSHPLNLTVTLRLKVTMKLMHLGSHAIKFSCIQLLYFTQFWLLFIFTQSLVY